MFHLHLNDDSRFFHLHTRDVTNQKEFRISGLSGTLFVTSVRSFISIICDKKKKVEGCETSSGSFIDFDLRS